MKRTVTPPVKIRGAVYKAEITEAQEQEENHRRREAQVITHPAHSSTVRTDRSTPLEALEIDLQFLPCSLAPTKQEYHCKEARTKYTAGPETGPKYPSTSSVHSFSDPLQSAVCTHQHKVVWTDISQRNGTRIFSARRIGIQLLVHVCLKTAST